MKFSLPLIFIIVNFIFSTSSNNRVGAGLDIGSKGSGIFFNYLSGNNKKNFDFVGELRYFDIKGSFTGLYSRAMSSPDGQIRIPIN